jgi:two-component sensor histidine kinase
MYQAMHQDQDEDRAILGTTLAEKERPLATEALLVQGLLRRVQDSTRLILGLLALQADRAGDPEVRRDLGGLAARALATAHERLDRAGAATVNLAAYLRELCDHLARFHLGLGIDLTLAVEADDGVAVATGDAVTLGLIVNELVADGAERAIPGREGEIRVELRAAAGTGKARLTVADNGRGLPEGGRIEPGLRLVEGLAALLGAELAIACSSKRGTHATLAFFLPAPCPPQGHARRRPREP